MKFRIVWGRRKDGTLGYHVRIKDGNNRIIFSSQVYKYKRSALEAIALVKVHAPGAVVVDQTKA